MNRERLETKLFIPRDVNDEPNTEEIAKIRELEKEFTENPDFGGAFVGLGIFGSLLSGYSSEESDIDLVVLYDGKKTKPKASQIRNEVLSSGETKDVTLAVADINPENISAGLRDWLKHYYIDKEHKVDRALAQEEIQATIIITLAEMTRIVTGTKINEYRKAISEFLKKMSVGESDKIKEAIIENLAESDNYRLSKRKKRMPELTEADHQEILGKRKEMWRLRVKRVWGFED